MDVARRAVNELQIAGHHPNHVIAHHSAQPYHRARRERVQQRLHPDARHALQQEIRTRHRRQDRCTFRIPFTEEALDFPDGLLTSKKDQPDLCPGLLRGFELDAMESLRRKQRGLLLLRNNSHRAVTLSQGPVLESVHSHLEPHQLRVTDLSHDFMSARHLFLADHLPDLLLAPLDAFRFSFDDAFPGPRRFLVRQEQERPRFSRCPIVKLPERRRAISRRAFGGIGKHINPEPVGEVVVLVCRSIDRFLQRHQLRQLRQQPWRFQTRVQLHQLPKKFCRHRGRAQRAIASWFQFAHQLAQHHFQHRQQHAQLDGRGLHPRRAGNGHRAGGEIDFLDARLLDHLPAAFDMLAQHVVGVVMHKIALRPDLNSLPGRADHKRRFASLRDRKHHMFGRNP